MPTRFDDEHDEFLQKLNAQLRRMPQADQAEIHTEVRQHLDDLAKAHEELGATTDEAARAALRQFGDPVKIGRRLFDEWRLTPQTNLWRIAGWAFLRLWATQAGLGVLCIVAMRSLLSLDNTVRNIFAPIYYGAVSSTFFLVPLFVGAWANRRFGRQALPGLVLMSASTFILSPVLSPLMAFLWSPLISPPPSFNYFHLDFQAYQHQSFQFHFSLLASAWLAQKFDGSPRLSFAGLKSRFRR